MYNMWTKANNYNRIQIDNKEVNTLIVPNVIKYIQIWFDFLICFLFSKEILWQNQKKKKNSIEENYVVPPHTS